MSFLSFYKGTLSFLFKVVFGGGCRFVPTCSEYAKDAISAHGTRKGTLFAVKRLLKCHPWGGCGFDPVPGKGR